MKTAEFEYELPKELIAQSPMEPRDHSRLMVVDRSDGEIYHKRFYDLPDYLRGGVLLVFNDSRVIPARLYGNRVGTGGKVEVLLLSRISDGVWRSLVRPGRRMRAGDRFEISKDGVEMIGEILEVEPSGTRTVRLSDDSMLDRVGVVPLPPYIRRPLEDPERYQNVYARPEGSVAAPTAGLHFTEGLLERVRAKGVETAFVTLHVGWDSFRPVQTEDVTAHRMHTEYWELGEAAADAINRAKADGRRVVSVGTTVTRLLEHAAATSADGDGRLLPGSGQADLFIVPGYEFRIVDALVTNFHLPRSSLLMLTSAFAGRDLLFRTYQEAIEQRYRFYSFGDAMVVV